MGLNHVLAYVRATAQRESDKQRYTKEEASAERVRKDLETGDPETWILDTLETEEVLG